jgi:hypothetical protein
MLDRFFNTFTGVTAPVVGVIASFQDGLEDVFRWASLLIGLAVGLISLYRALRNLDKD